MLQQKELDRYPTKNNQIIAYRIIDGQAIVINLKQGIFNALNNIATKIWELADGQTQTQEIINQIHQEFEVGPKELKADCLEFLNQMINKELLILSTCAKGGNQNGR